MKLLKARRPTSKDVLKTLYYMFLSSLILITLTFDVEGLLPFSGITQIIQGLGLSQGAASVIAFFFYLMVIGHGMNYVAKRLMRIANRRHRAQEADPKDPPKD
ncbi:MAG: hypothetical protein ROO70_01445 [Labrenzia sp.]